MKMQIRPFQMDDYDAVYRLWEHAGPGLGLGRSDARGEIEKKLARDPDLFLVALTKDQLVGTVMGGFDGRRGIVYHLAVQSAYRGQGIGKLLMDQVERRLAAKGCLRCYLLVKPEIVDAVAFYRHLGWEPIPVSILGKNIA